MTLGRMIVVLRGELGSQLSLARKERNKFREEIEGEYQLYARGGEQTKSIKIYTKMGAKVRRLQTAVDALGAIQLGDIEDKEF